MKMNINEALYVLTHDKKNPLGMLKMMIGAHNFTKDPEKNCILFKFKGSKKYNHLQIGVNGSDLYEIFLFRVATMNQVQKGKPYIYNREKWVGTPPENIRGLIESETGLTLNLFK